MYLASRFTLQRAAHKIRHVQPGRIGRIPFISRARSYSSHTSASILEAPNGQTEISINGPSRRAMNLPLIWLRDHCHCKQCVNQDTMQRAFDTFSVPYDSGAQYCAGEKSLSIRWSDGHASEYTWEWLEARQNESHPPIKQTFWGSAIKDQPPSVHYDDVMSGDEGVAKWTSKIMEYGFCFVDGCPISPEKTQKLLERIAFIRMTHYGGFYDFTSDLTIKDTAYTSLALPAHSDNTYFTDPSGLQMFHLLSHTSGTGGASLLVDAFHCANLLKKADPQAYKILCDVPVQWHASGNKGIIITPAQKFPILTLTRDGPVTQHELLQVRWNNDDRATMPLEPAPNIGIKDWYKAARVWDSILRDKANEYWEQLIPGRPLIFNNWRVLHGRSAFTGKRRMCGGYINRDDFVSRYYNTNFPRGDVLRRII